MMEEEEEDDQIYARDNDHSVVDITMPDGRKVTKTVKEIVEKLNDLRKHGLLFQHASGALYLILKGSRSYTTTDNINDFLGYVFFDKNE
ncbi:MAG: hypothetical protein WCF06_03780 [Nitrososphaeraceae archaeon]